MSLFRAALLIFGSLPILAPPAAARSVGVSTRLPLTCPRDNNPMASVVVQVFEDVQRGGNGPTAAPSSSASKSNAALKPRTQRELVERTLTGQELMTRLAAAAKKYLKHRWESQWDLHHRRLLFDTFTDDTLVVMTDFSATANLDPQYRLNSAISGHAIQDVFIVSHSPTVYINKKGNERRVIRNEAWHCWGEETKKKLTNDNFFHAQSLDHIIDYYKNVKKLPFRRVVLMSDGCPFQYKLRKNCVCLVDLAVKFSVDVDHTCSPTATFKTSVDGAGKDAKFCLNRLERAEEEGTRAGTAREAFNVLRKHMPQPVERDLETCLLNSLSARHHILLVDKSQALPEDAHDPDVIVTDYEKDKWDCKPIAGIKSVYAFHASHSSPHSIYFRALRCWCSSCLTLGLESTSSDTASSTGACTMASRGAGKWTAKSLKNITRGAVADMVQHVDEEEKQLQEDFTQPVYGDGANGEGEENLDEDR